MHKNYFMTIIHYQLFHVINAHNCNMCEVSLSLSYALQLSLVATEADMYKCCNSFGLWWTHVKQTFEAINLETSKQKQTTDIFFRQTVEKLAVKLFTPAIFPTHAHHRTLTHTHLSHKETF